MKSISTKRKINQPTLRFSPYAWAKLLFLRDLGDTEVGGFGICHGDDLLLIDDVQLVRQVCSEVTVEFDDESVADFFDQQVDAGRRPEQFARHWVHTHPGDCARPSATDEQTFARVFGSSEWALMFILAQEGEAFARLQFHVGPKAGQQLAIEIDYSPQFSGSNWEAWEEEYLSNVQQLTWSPKRGSEVTISESTEKSPQAWRDAWHSYTDEEFLQRIADE